MLSSSALKNAGDSLLLKVTFCCLLPPGTRFIQAHQNMPGYPLFFPHIGEKMRETQKKGDI